MQKIMVSVALRGAGAVVKLDTFVDSVLVKDLLSVDAGHVVMQDICIGTVTAGSKVIYMVMTMIDLRGGVGHVVMLVTYTDTVTVGSRDVHLVREIKSM